MAERRVGGVRESERTVGSRGSGKPPWCDLRGEKYTRRSALVARVAAHSSAVDADGGKVGKKCGESGLDRYPGVGHLLDLSRR